VLSAVLVTAIVALAVGIMGLRSLSASASAADGIYADNLAGVAAAADMEIAVHQMRQKARDAVIAVTPDDSQAAMDELLALRTQFDDAAQRYRAGGLDRQRQQVFDQLTTALDTYLRKQKRLMAPLAIADDNAPWLEAKSGSCPRSPRRWSTRSRS
jgi:methyl-accepting chemotaxis protein